MAKRARASWPMSQASSRTPRPRCCSDICPAGDPPEKKNVRTFFFRWASADAVESLCSVIQPKTTQLAAEQGASTVDGHRLRRAEARPKPVHQSLEEVDGLVIGAHADHSANELPLLRPLVRHAEGQ